MLVKLKYELGFFESMKKVTSPYVLIKKSGIHNKGAFAKKFIPKGAKVIEYVGEKISKKEGDRRIEEIEKRAKEKGIIETYYIFTLDKKWDIDGDVPWNPAKWFNHSCEPNCETENEDGKIWVVSMRDIQKGEELTYDYGFRFGEGYESLKCNCGSDKCVGYVITRKDWPELKKELDGKYKKWPKR